MCKKEEETGPLLINKINKRKKSEINDEKHPNKRVNKSKRSQLYRDK
jgi:hypothetical protein